MVTLHPNSVLRARHAMVPKPSGTYQIVAEGSDNKEATFPTAESAVKEVNKIRGRIIGWSKPPEEETFKHGPKGFQRQRQKLTIQNT